MIIKETLDAYAADQQRVWAHDRTQTIGASDIGQCARKSFWIKNEGDRVHGVPRDADYVDSWGARARGTVMENHFWEPAMRLRFGDRLLFAGAEQQTFVAGFLSATPDGLLTNLMPEEKAAIAPKHEIGNEVMVECKSIDPRTNITEAKAENMYQTQVQMGLVRELTPFKPTHSVLSYMDASFWSEVAEFVIPFDPKIFENAKKRAGHIMTATSPNELQPEGYIAGGRECNYCPFNKPCGVIRRRVPDGQALAKLDPQFIAEMTDLARGVKTAEKSRDASEVQVREMQQKIKDRMRDKNIRKVPGIVNWTSVKGRQSWDNVAIREALLATGADITEFETVGEPTDRLTITLKEA